MSFFDNYKYGCFLRNHCGVGKEYIANAIPFEVSHLGSEKIPLPPQAVRKSSFIKVSRHAQFVTKTKQLTKIYNLKSNKFDDFVDSLTTPSKCHALHTVMLNRKDPRINDYIVKVIPARTWKDVHTAEKELHMTDKVYKSTYMGFCGSDIVCKPFFGCLFWSGKKWKYVSVFEKASGTTMTKIKKPKFKLFGSRYDKSKLLRSVMEAVKTLWMLGFAHNDLYGANLCYDSNTNKVKIIDFEMAVKLPELTVDKLRSSLQEFEHYFNTETAEVTEDYCNNFAKVFYDNAKDMSISLLSLVKDVCYVNADEDDIIYNTDENILPVLFERL